MDVHNKVALVTGGTKGIGAATAIALAKEGVDAAIVGRHLDDETLAVKEAIEAQGRRCAVLQHDLTIPEEAIECVRETRDQLGTVDILVHCAGGGSKGDIFTCPPKEWYALFDVHVQRPELSLR